MDMDDGVTQGQSDEVLVMIWNLDQILNMEITQKLLDGMDQVDSMSISISIHRTHIKTQMFRKRNMEATQKIEGEIFISFSG